MAVKPVSEMDDEQFRKHYLMRHGDLPGFHEGEEPMRKYHQEMHAKRAAAGYGFAHTHRDELDAE